MIWTYAGGYTVYYLDLYIYIFGNIKSSVKFFINGKSWLKLIFKSEYPEKIILHKNLPTQDSIAS